MMSVIIIGVIVIVAIIGYLFLNRDCIDSDEEVKKENVEIEENQQKIEEQMKEIKQDLVEIENGFEEIKNIEHLEQIKKIDKEQYREMYCKKHFFNVNEQEDYLKLKKIADELGYLVFAKVKILDLFDCYSKNSEFENFNYFRYRDKYFDFVFCDDKLKVKYIIKLSKEFEEKDPFLYECFEAIGYKIIEIDEIDESLKKELV